MSDEVTESELIMGFVKWTMHNGKRLDVYSYPEIETMIDEYLS